MVFVCIQHKRGLFKQVQQKQLPPHQNVLDEYGTKDVNPKTAPPVNSYGTSVETKPRSSLPPPSGNSYGDSLTSEYSDKPSNLTESKPGSFHYGTTLSTLPVIENSRPKPTAPSTSVVKPQQSTYGTPDALHSHGIENSSGKLSSELTVGYGDVRQQPNNNRRRPAPELIPNSLDNNVPPPRPSKPKPGTQYPLPSKNSSPNLTHEPTGLYGESQIDHNVKMASSENNQQLYYRQTPYIHEASVYGDHPQQQLYNITKQDPEFNLYGDTPQHPKEQIAMADETPFYGDHPPQQQFQHVPKASESNNLYGDDDPPYQHITRNNEVSQLHMYGERQPVTSYAPPEYQQIPQVPVPQAPFQSIYSTASYTPTTSTSTEPTSTNVYGEQEVYDTSEMAGDHLNFFQGLSIYGDGTDSITSYGKPLFNTQSVSDTSVAYDMPRTFKKKQLPEEQLYGDAN
eukprot:gene7207-9671_t